MEKEKKLASIAVLTYKNFETLKTAIDSVCSQNYSRIELIIQDDGSPNYDGEYVAELAKKAGTLLENVVVNSNPRNLGTVKSFNRALEISTGDVIIPLACDDKFYDDDTVGAIMRVFEDPAADVCTAKRIGMQSGQIYPDSDDAKILKRGEKKEILGRLFYSNFISGSSTSYRKAYLDKLGGFDTNYRLMEDYPMAIKTVLSGNKIRFLDRVIIVYNEDGISSKGVKAKGINPMYVKDNKTCYEKEIIPNLKLICNRKIERFVMFTYDHVFADGKIQRMLSMVKYPDIVWEKLIVKLLNKNEYKLLTR